MGRFSGVLLVSDYDDTLVDREKKVPLRTKQALEEFTRQGGAFTIASGRVLQSVLSETGGLPVNAPLITANGTQLYDTETGETLFEARLPESAPADFAEILREFPSVALEIVTPDGKYSVNPNLVTKEHLRITGMTVIPAELGDVPRPWVSVQFEAPRQELIQVRAYIEKRFPGRYELFYSHIFLLELAPLGVNKGFGVLETAKRLGISRENIYCAGDNENDVSMLRAAKMSFVPENGTAEAKGAADVIVSDCDLGAVADVVEFLKKRYPA